MAEYEPSLVLITGPTNSGKTTLAEAVSQSFDPPLTRHSQDAHDLYPTGTPPEQIAHITNWEDPDLFDMDRFFYFLSELKDGRSITLYDRSRERLAQGGGEDNLKPTAVVIADGFAVLHDPRAQKLFDATIYVDLPEEEMVRRRKLRRGEPPWEPWDTDEYIEGTMLEATQHLVLPQKELVDLVLDGTLPIETLKGQALQFLHDKLPVLA